MHNGRVDNIHNVLHKHVLRFNLIRNNLLIFFSEIIIHTLFIKVVQGVFDFGKAKQMAVLGYLLK